VHYLAHIPYRPPTRLGRWIEQYHLRHHFISEKHWFGVSNPRWTACSAHSRTRRRAKEPHHPQLPFLREGFPSRGKAGVIEWRFSGTFRS
jgi:hypothetical protein